MTTAIYRAAKAIADRWGEKLDGPLTSARSGGWHADARAALATTREPTPEMIAAGAKKVRGGSPSDCAAATWRVMWDKMMGEGKVNEL